MRQLRVFRISCLAFLGLFFLTPGISAQHSPTNAAELSVKKLQSAPGLKVELFASAPLFENPVAFSIDERGRFFIAETHRYKDSIFDITRETNWLMNDLSFRTVEDRAVFLQKQFATNLNFLTKDSELVRLVEDRDGDGHAETSSILADGFNQTVSGTAAGILARKGEVWFACIPDLWKISEPNGAAPRESAGDLNHDKSSALPQGAATKKNLATGFGVHIGVSGHDLHGLVMGPDGKIYFSSGDRGFSVHTKEGKFLNNPDSGGVLRCNPDGSDLEIFATGLRNPQELAFDQYGNLFTDDNDTAGEDKSRLIYVVEGGDYGWRASYQFMDGYGPWVQETNWLGGIDGTLPWSGEVAQGPAGLAFYPGTGLPEKYQNHFLACDFPKGVWSFAVKPKGASYEVIEKEKFLWNFGATDIAFGPDGAAYALDWGQSYSMPENGRIYRVFDDTRSSRGDEAHSKSSKEKNRSLVTSAATSVKQLLAEGMENRSIEELAKLLGHPDMRVRMEAQFALETKVISNIPKLGSTKLAEQSEGVKALTELILTVVNTNQIDIPAELKSKVSQLARIHALWALEKISQQNGTIVDWCFSRAFGPSNISPPVQATVSTIHDSILKFLNGGGAHDLLKENDDEIRAQVIRILGQGKYAPAVDSLIRSLADTNPRVRFFAAMSLGKLKDKNSIAPILELLKQNVDQDAYLVHAGVWALVNIGDFDAIQSAAKNENISIRRAALLAMRRLERTEISQFLNDPEPKLVREAARAINDVPINEAMPELAAKVGQASRLPRSGETPDLLARAINANFRLGQKTNAIALADFSANTNASEDMRAEALDALSDWENPSQIDRVMGLWRPLPKREIAPAQNAFHTVASQLFKSDSEKVLLATIRCARKLKLNDSALFSIFKMSHSPVVRVEILRTLAELKSGDLPKAVKLALADSNRDLRREGIKSIALLAPEQAPPFLEKLLATETDLRIRQTAFATLGRLTNAPATEVLLRQLNLLLGGKIAPELHLDLLDAADGRSDSRIVESLNRYKASLAQNDSFSNFRVALVGGEAERGSRIFHAREDVACLRCHAIKGVGGNVGPDLTGIAKKQSREYFLESILQPNKQIAAGFENIVVTLKNGTVAAGLVKSEDKDELVLNSPEDGIVTIQKTEIEKRERGLSSMPEGMDKVLTKFEVRDLIEFLASLK